MTIVSQPTNQNYRDHFDAIFRRRGENYNTTGQSSKEPEPWQPDSENHIRTMSEQK